MRRLVLRAMAFSVAMAASARANVGVLPIEVEGAQAAEAADIDAQLRQAIGTVLLSGGTFLPMPPAHCAASTSCLQSVARAASVDELAIVHVERLDTSPLYLDISVQVVNADAKPVIARRAQIHTTTAASDLRALFVAVFDPAHFASPVQVAAPADVQVLVDGLPLTAGLLQLSVGEHTISGTDADGTTRKFVVDVPYAPQGLRYTIPASTTTSEWPVVLGSGAVLAMGGVAIATAVAAVVQQQNAALQRGNAIGGAVHPAEAPLGLTSVFGKEGWADARYGSADADGAAGQRLRFTGARAVQAESYDVAAQALWWASAAVAGATLVSAAAFYTLWWCSPDESLLQPEPKE